MGWFADLLMLLALLLLFGSGCVKKFPIIFPSETFQGYGLQGIFRDDFPFYISPKTPEPSTAIPPTRTGCSVKILPYGPENFALRAELMRNARSHIYLQNYIFANDSTGQATAQIFKEKLAQSVSVYLIVDAYNKLDNLHSKVSIFDGEVSVIGSYNFDPRCKYLNSENVLVIDSEKTARALTDYIFQNDLPRSELVSLEKAKANRWPKEPTKFIRLTWALMVKDYW